MASLSQTELLRALLTAAQTVWDEYRESGPGRVDAALYDAVHTAARGLESNDADKVNPALVATLRDLSKRCCLRSEGLCFITGEAGLIPRQDLHESYERSLEELRVIVETSDR